METTTIVVTVLLLLSWLVEGMKNVKHAEVVQRVKQAYQNAPLYQNVHGTCALNTLLFLRSIDLQTFQQLSKNIGFTHESLDLDLFEYLLNKKHFLKTTWVDIDHSDKHHGEWCDSLIEQMTTLMESMRQLHHFERDDDLLTAIVFPQKGKHHTVVLWLTNKNELIVIDPQVFANRQELVLFSGSPDDRDVLDNDPVLAVQSLRNYIETNIDPPRGAIILLQSLHTEEQPES